ncbi:MAG TPA: hypothetical protein VH985_21935, partial [Candidatus Binatia bacterium]
MAPAMPRSKLNFFPLAFPFVLSLFLLIGLLIVFFEFGVIQYAYEKIGIDRRYVFALLRRNCWVNERDKGARHMPRSITFQIGRNSHGGSSKGSRRTSRALKCWPPVVLQTNNSSSAAQSPNIRPSGNGRWRNLSKSPSMRTQEIAVKTIVIVQDSR